MKNISMRFLIAIVFVLFPVAGYCDWGSSVSDLFGLKGRNMKEVATKIATLSEENSIWGLDFSPDGKHLAATPSGSATVHIWDWQGNCLERTLEREKGTNVTVTEPVRYSPDGKLSRSAMRRVEQVASLPAFGIPIHGMLHMTSLS
jgi:WD40 repeat protein